jgi:hypothetical protein
METNLTIQQLMMEKLAGIISAVDEANLDYLIETDGTIAAIWNQTKRMYHAEDLDNEFSRFDQLNWIDITIDNPKDAKGTVVNLKRMYWAAAVLAIGVISTAWFFNHATRNVEKSFINDKSAGIRLHLANGGVVNLSKSDGTIKTEEAQLSNNNKTLSFSVDTKDKSSLKSGTNTLTVPIGLDYKITLSDGTEVWMNSATTLHFPFSFTGKSREISIDGEAFLKVASDPGKPFFVHTAKSTIQVLGTSFNVNSYDSGTIKVSLVEGAVRMNAGNESVTVKPGMQAVLNASGIHMQSFNEEEELGWRNGLHYFENTTLTDIAKVLPRWFGMHVIMDNAAIGNERFTGRIDRNIPIRTFLDDLKATITVDYYFDDKGILHFK